MNTPRIRSRAVTLVDDGLFEFCSPLMSNRRVYYAGYCYLVRRLEMTSSSASSVDLLPDKTWSIDIISALNNRVVKRLDVQQINSWLLSQTVCRAINNNYNNNNITT